MEQNLTERNLSRRQERSVRRNVIKCAQVLLIYVVLSIILKFITSLFLPDGICEALSGTGAFILTFFVLFKRDFYGGTAEISNETMKNGAGTLQGVFMYIAATVVTFAIVAIVVLVFQLAGVNLLIPVKMSIPVKGVSGIIYGIYMCIAVPVMSSVVFRGFVLGKLKEFGTKKAVYASAILYALMHGFYILIPVAFVVGVIMGNFAMKCKSVQTVVKSEVIASFLIYATMFAMSSKSKFLIVPLAICMIFTVAGVISMLTGSLKKIDDGKTEDNENFNRIFYTNGTVLFVMVLMIVRNILFMLN